MQRVRKSISAIGRARLGSPRNRRFRGVGDPTPTSSRSTALPWDSTSSCSAAAWAGWPLRRPLGHRSRRRSLLAAATGVPDQGEVRVRR